MDNQDSKPQYAYIPHLFAGEAIIPRVPPLPIYSFALEERLLGRFDSIWDPMPGRFDVRDALAELQISESISTTPLAELNINPPPALISAPDPRAMLDIVLKGLNLGMEYIAIFGRSSQLAGLKRYDRLYRHHPPSRVYVLSEARSYTTLDRSGRDGGPYFSTWVVWDGAGQPAIENPPTEPTMRWISEKSTFM